MPLGSKPVRGIFEDNVALKRGGIVTPQTMQIYDSLG